ncbi:MAG: hypothetical protein ABL998_06220 [Planctomycetota bacterium]
MTQIEVLCATAVLMVAALAFSRAMVASMHLADSTRQQALASEAARRVLEEMQDATFADLIKLYNASTADDQVGVTSPGATFVVEGLTPAADDADGIVGAVEFPTTAGVLHENADRPDFGLPRDLDGSGAVDAADHTTDYALLPVRIVVRWRSNNGPMQVELKSLLAAR